MQSLQMAGKEYTIVVLSSSPPAPDALDSPHYAAPSRRVAMPLSSPFVLSPPSSPRRNTSGALASGSRLAPIPGAAIRGFSTVGSLVRSEHFAQQLDDNTTDLHQVRSRETSNRSTDDVSAAAKKPGKRATKIATSVEGEKPKPKPRGRKPKPNKEANNEDILHDPELRHPQPRATKSPFFEGADARTTLVAPTEPAAIEPKLTKSGKPRKPRAKKDSTEVKPKRRRVTKPKTTTKTSKAQQEAADVVSTHFPVDKDQSRRKSGEPEATGDAIVEDASMWDVPRSPRSKQEGLLKHSLPELPVEGFDLEEAVSRRRDWTPPMDTVAQSPSTISVGKENRPSMHDAMAGAFTHLVSNFTYESPTAKVPTKSTSKPKTIDAAPPSVMKRRRVELVELPGAQTTSRASSPEKGKAPKKKPRTITDLVTEQYASKAAGSDVLDVTSNFFSPRTNTTKVPLNDANGELQALQKKPARKRSKSRDGSEGATTKAKPRARKATSKPPAKPKPVVEKLLSPTSAVLRMSRQDLMFGTSSQLALEESPTTVRQLQRALTESEQDTGPRPYVPLEAPPRWPRLQRVEGRRGLWRESTRDSDGGLLEDNESIYIPEPDRTDDLPLLMDVAHGEPSLPSGLLDIDDIEPAAPIAISSDLPTSPRPISQTQTTNLILPRGSPTMDGFNDIDDFDSGLPPSNQNATSQNSFADIDDFQRLPALTSGLSPSLRIRAPTLAPARGTDSPKKRLGRPPKPKAAISTIPASAPAHISKPTSLRQSPQSLPSTPFRGSGRFIDIEEILDSEDEALEIFSPTPPRAHKSRDPPPLPLASDRDLSDTNGHETDEVGTSPIVRILTSQLEWANIRPSISASISAHIRSIPPTTNPKKPSWHEKILMYDPIVLEDFTAYLNGNTKLRTYKRATQKQIKAFNTALKMKGNAILGLERNDQVMAIEKELEVYMVRDWCQEMSICCIHAKESRGRGSARKGFY